MKILKINNKKYQVRKMYKGKTYYLFFENKPSQKEIKKAYIEKLKSDTKEHREKGKTLKYYINEYIENKKSVLSPSTIKSYFYILKIYPTELMEQKLYNINNNTLQKYINELSDKNKKLKTIKNHIGLITATLTYNGYNKKFFLKYPKHIKIEPYIPSDNDIKKLNHYIKNTKYYIFFRLCLYGLRVSEIMALTTNDIKSDGNIIINKSKVKGIDGEWHIKTTKTEKSTRHIFIDSELATTILKQGYIINHTYKQFYMFLTAAIEKLKITYFSPHKLRHYIASKMHLLNIPSKYIQAYGGWASDNILKSVYTHAIDKEKIKYNNIINQEINNILNKSEV